MTHRGKGVTQLAFSLLFCIAALWCLMWVFSSASLASGYCESNFSLFHEEFRCKQPYIASILFLVSIVNCGVLFLLGFKNYKLGGKVT
ncbi:hypothetical protein tinsulaeT_00010 [Thalassotalea insulae]|uniref:Uncharacterized protein n=1 Tax=Thalassotalea insulae TaxID=2056778 RepID=A0ABQ6GLE0_9GAMM|nr:hypothetical protein tinsulaeT_00010 [Thalassotalea insulae]